MKNKEIYLPLFWGFYNSIHELDEDYLTEDFEEENEKLCEGKTRSEIQDLFDAKYDINYTEYKIDYCKEYLWVFENQYLKGLKEIWFWKFEYKSVYSPREYNFWSDEINVEVEYDFDKIVKYLKKQRVAFTSYIERKNSGYDGFTPFWTTYFDKYISKDDFEPFELTQIMNFYIKVVLDDDDFIELHRDTLGNICEFNYLITKEKWN